MDVTSAAKPSRAIIVVATKPQFNRYIDDARERVGALSRFGDSMALAEGENQILTWHRISPIANSDKAQGFPRDTTGYVILSRQITASLRMFLTSRFGAGCNV